MKIEFFYGRKRELLLIVLFPVLSFLAGAQETRKLNADILITVRALSHPVISPDGKRVAFELLTPSGPDSIGSRPDKDIWLVAADGSTPPSRFAGSPSRDFAPAWSPDGSRLAFLSDRGGDGKTSLYIADVERPRPRRALRFPRNISSFRWVSDTLIAFLAEDTVDTPRKNDAVVVGKEKRFSRLWELDLKRGSWRCVSAAGEHVIAFDYSPQGDRIVMRVAPDAEEGAVEYHSVLKVTDRHGLKEKMLGGEDQGFSLDHAWGSPRWSPDGKRIASFVKVKTTYLPVVFNVQEGRGHILAADYRGTIWYMDWNPATGELFFSANRGVQGLFGRIDPASGEITPVKEVNRSYSETQNWSFSADGRWVAYQDAEKNSPDDIWLMHADGSGVRRLTVMNPRLSGFSFGEQRVIRWQSRDGRQIEGLLILPVDYDPSHPWPLVVQIHGGPVWAWWNGFLANWHEWAQLLATNGFAVLYPNPRGSNGYGLRFALENIGDWGGGDFEDILSGVDYLIREGIADSTRLGIGGWSYGGYMTAWAVTQTGRFRAAVMGASVTDLLTMYSLSGRPENFSVYMGGKPYGEKKKVYIAHSPVTFVGQTTTPTLILHGEKDPVVPLSQSYEFYQGFRDHQVKTEFVIYPRESHGISESIHQKDLMMRVVEWFSEYLKQ